MKALAFTVSFVLAFLLFAVQPMATKMVLPVLGGTPAVWNTAMLTFQLLLLGGYAYAHYLSKLTPRRQWRLHGMLIAASFLCLPLSVHLTSSDALLEAPIPYLIGAFLTQVGLPFFALSATAPLLQSWVSRSDDPLSKTPYVLYSASNLGSMMGLIGYVALIEPNFGLSEQSQYWSLLFVLGTAALLMTGLKLKPQPVVETVSGERPRTRQILLWVWLAFLPSALSLAVTSYITTDIAAVPLLWVLPLALYLLSFVDAFQARPILVPVAIRVAPILGMMGLLAYGLGAHRYSEILIAQLVIFMLLAFALHGWLARAKPAPQYLTAFYFSMSVGGALGGVLNALVAPLVFNETLEYPISLLLASLTAFILWQANAQRTWREHLVILASVLGKMLLTTLAFYVLFGLVMGDFTVAQPTFKQNTMIMASCFSLLVVLFTSRRYVQAFYGVAVLGMLLLVASTHDMDSKVIFQDRSFFGVWKVLDQPDQNTRFLMHNTTLHGVQEMKQDGPLRPLSYYAALTSSFLHLPVLHQHPFALVGLGSGTVKCHANKGQRVDIFDIDPMVIKLAEDPHMFRYLTECPGTYKVYLGDGRIGLGQRPDKEYGGIVIDAFSSDSIPAHIVTTDALRMYMRKLAPHGVLLLHTTNRHLDLWPLMAAQANALGLVAYAKHFEPAVDDKLVFASFWVVMARDEQDLKPLLESDAGWNKLEADPAHRAWSDDYVNIIPYLKVLHKH